MVLKEITNRAAREAKRNIPPLKKVAPWLSSEIVQIVEQAMKHDPARRFEDYEEFRTDLEMARMVLKAKGTKVPVHGAIRAKRRERDDAHRRVWLLGVWAVAFAALVAGSIHFFKVGRGDRAEEDPKGPHLVLDPERDPTLDPEVAMQINEAYEGARQALADDDFVVAEEQFLRVWHNEQAPTETGAWAGFEAAVAAFLDGRSADARQHLADLYDRERMSLNDIAATVGVSRQTIARLAADYGLPLRQPGRHARTTIDRDWLYDQYVNKHRALPDIAKEAGMSTANIARWAKRYAIPLRGRGGGSHRARRNIRRPIGQSDRTRSLPLAPSSTE